MSDPVACDECGAVGPRRRGQIAPEGWLFLEAADEVSNQIGVVYACGERCALLMWRRGPGSLPQGSAQVKDATAQRAFPDGGW